MNVKPRPEQITVRDLHAIAPDDYNAGSHDVAFTNVDGHQSYSEDIFDSRDDAKDYAQRSWEIGIELVDECRSFVLVEEA